MCLTSLKGQETTVWVRMWVGVSLCVCVPVCVICVSMHTHGCEGM